VGELLTFLARQPSAANRHASAALNVTDDKSGSYRCSLAAERGGRSPLSSSLDSSIVSNDTPAHGYDLRKHRHQPYKLSHQRGQGLGADILIDGAQTPARRERHLLFGGCAWSKRLSEFTVSPVATRPSRQLGRVALSTSRSRPAATTSMARLISSISTTPSMPISIAIAS